MKKQLITLIFITTLLGGCDILKELELQTSMPLTTSEIVQGLKEALKVGTNNAVTALNIENGFYGNPLLKIPFPEEVKVVEEKLRAVGLDKIVDDFILNMNRGAEKAVSKAGPIFMNAIKEMTFDDARNILKGPDNAATEYFRNKTSTELSNAFEPGVQETLDQMHVTKYWSDVMTAYNKIPFTRSVETNLAKYVTEKTVKGVFHNLAKEEKLIRSDPKARVTEILRRVFGSASS
ncbi:MAG: DUF4197 domain-containing protein [Bacteroidales bacterium]|nr:DUF4197 domain-containing protein [Bacteroidales bacterium]